MEEELNRIQNPAGGKMAACREEGFGMPYPDTGKSEDFSDVIDRSMHLPRKDWSQYPPLSLAWIGDTVYDLIVRSVLLKRGMTNPDRLHRSASGIVSAKAQAALMEQIRGHLTKEERAVYRRGRNAKPAHQAKNAGREAYLEATGFECLIGYLYLTRQYDRILELCAPEGITEDSRDRASERISERGISGYGARIQTEKGGGRVSD